MPVVESAALLRFYESTYGLITLWCIGPDTAEVSNKIQSELERSSLQQEKGEGKKSMSKVVEPQKVIYPLLHLFRSVVCYVTSHNNTPQPTVFQDRDRTHISY